MRTSAIIRKGTAGHTAANLIHYAWVRHDFTWDHVWDSWLAGLPGRAGWNIGYEAIDRHLTTDRRDKTAIRYVAPRGSAVDLTYAALGRRTSRFANLLAALGLQSHERVVILGSGLDRVVATLGTLRCGAVAAPVPAGLDAATLLRHLAAVAGAVMVTTAEDYERYVAPIRDRLPSVRHVFVTGDGRPPAGTRGLAAALATAGTAFTVPPTDRRRPAMMHAGTAAVGRARTVIHPHEAVAAQYVSGLYALDLHPSDVLWCTARPGTLGATTYAIITPLSHGATTVLRDAPFDPVAWPEVVRTQQVTVCLLGAEELCALYRSRSAGPAAPPTPSLRLLTSDREGPDAEAVHWTGEALGRPVHDSWWQPETGAIAVANYAGMDVRPGSIGLPMPGAEVALVERIPGAGIRFVAPRTEGELAVRADWPGMCLQRSGGIAVRGGWYLSGVRARQDEDGHLWLDDPRGAHRSVKSGRPSAVAP